jgi:hypothetical protein
MVGGRRRCFSVPKMGVVRWAEVTKRCEVQKNGRMVVAGGGWLGGRGGREKFLGRGEKMKIKLSKPKYHAVLTNF